MTIQLKTEQMVDFRIERKAEWSPIVSPTDKHATKEQLVTEVVYLSALCNVNTNRCVFINFSGHVQVLEISICESKEEFHKKLASARISLKPYQSLTTDEEIQAFEEKTIQRLLEVRTVLLDFLREGDINPDYFNKHVEVVERYSYTF